MTEIQTTKYENLTFEGGGVRGHAYAGAIKQLDDMGYLKNFKRFSGTSVGALFAAMLAADFTSDEILCVKDRLNFSEFSPTLSLRSLYGVWDEFGINSIHDLSLQFRDILKDRVDPEISLSDLFKKTGKELVIVTCCVSREKAVYLHHALFPEVRLIDAMIASVSVPYIFKPSIFNWLGTDDYYVDGGIVDNYPLWVFNDLEKLYTGEFHKIDKEYISPLTIGLKLLCKGEHDDSDVYNSRKDINNIIKFSSELLNTLMMQIERSDISPTYIIQTVPIKTGNINFLDFKISRENIDILVRNGRLGVCSFFSEKKSRSLENKC
jgi:NTE family protein